MGLLILSAAKLHFKSINNQELEIDVAQNMEIPVLAVLAGDTGDEVRPSRLSGVILHFPVEKHFRLFLHKLEAFPILYTDRQSCLQYRLQRIS